MKSQRAMRVLNAASLTSLCKRHVGTIVCVACMLTQMLLRQLWRDMALYGMVRCSATQANSLRHEVPRELALSPVSFKHEFQKCFPTYQHPSPLNVNKKVGVI